MSVRVLIIVENPAYAVTGFKLRILIDDMTINKTAAQWCGGGRLSCGECDCKCTG